MEELITALFCYHYIVLKLIFQFLISGSVVVAATAIGQRVGQKWAGLLVAFPIWTILTYVFLVLGSKTSSYHEYLISSLVFMIPAAVFIASLLVLHRLNLWLSLVGGLVCYSLVAFAINRWLMGH